MDNLKFIFEKVSKYEFMTNLIPGIILAVIIRETSGWDIIPTEPVYAFFFLYFIGIANNRIGSLLIELIVNKTKLAQFESYSKFCKAESLDSKIGVMNIDNNMYRSLTTVFLISTCAYLYRIAWSNFTFLQINGAFLLLIVLFIVFFISYIKQCRKMIERIKNALSSHKQ